MGGVHCGELHDKNRAALCSHRSGRLQRSSRTIRESRFWVCFGCIRAPQIFYTYSRDWAGAWLGEPRESCADTIMKEKTHFEMMSMMVYATTWIIGQDRVTGPSTGN